MCSKEVGGGYAVSFLSLHAFCPSYMPFIPAKYYASLLPSYPPLAKGALYSKSGLESNDYWYEVQTTIGLLLE